MADVVHPPFHWQFPTTAWRQQQQCASFQLGHTHSSFHCLATQKTVETITAEIVLYI